ncbi:hypothetical protein [Hymenobacter swuensis]|uniref:Lipocalin-like domain-containing protein n=1 Tax=Hymenobacter swuensis DY53 TaxID=1227739 RepID=W8EQL5_9BACT|nr:hypothetical protein [Hymenobacter swuensis]AHJ95419.1 hypothetical protein Hsw_PA0086 [Hymenobacter swuensis DY53]
MRLLLFAFYLGSILLDAFLSCSGSGTPAPEKSMRFTLDGTEYDASANLSGRTRNDSIMVGTYAPQSAPAPSLGIDLRFPKAVGTYNLAVPAAGSATLTTYVYGANTQSTVTEKYYAGTKAGTVYGSGTVTVDSYTEGTVTGTFSFTAQHLGSGVTKIISGGRFSVQVQ